MELVLAAFGNCYSDRVNQQRNCERQSKVGFSLSLSGPKIPSVRNRLLIILFLSLSVLLQLRRRLRLGRAAEERDAGVDGDAESLAERAQEEPVPDQGREDHARHHHQNDPHAGRNICFNSLQLHCGKYYLTVLFSTGTTLEQTRSFRISLSYIDLS